MLSILFKHALSIPNGPLYISIDGHDKSLDFISGKYDFYTLHNSVPCFIKMVPNPTRDNKKEEEESIEKVPVTLQYSGKWLIESKNFSGWCITAFDKSFTAGDESQDGHEPKDGDKPQVIGLFELETTGYF